MARVLATVYWPMEDMAVVHVWARLRSLRACLSIPVAKRDSTREVCVCGCVPVCLHVGLCLCVCVCTEISALALDAFRGRHSAVAVFERM